MVKKIFSVLIVISILLVFIDVTTAKNDIRQNDIVIDLSFNSFLAKYLPMPDNNDDIKPTIVRKSLLIYQSDLLTIERLDDEYIVTDIESGEIIEILKKCICSVYSKSATKIRTYPNDSIKRYGMLDSNSGVLQIAANDEWSLVLSNSIYYFLESNELISDLENRPDNYVWTSDISYYSDYIEPAESWELLGKCRISTYCYKCNTPRNSYKSSIDGVPCSEWRTCAMNGVKLGTTIYVEGYGIFTVIDRGPKAMNGAKWVDMFVDCSSCNVWCKRNVWIVK